MSRDRLNLSKINFDPDADDVEKFRDFLVNNPQNENYGDDQDEIDALEQEDNPEPTEFERFNDYGEDSNEIIDMEEDVAAMESDIEAMGIEGKFISYTVRISVRTLRYFSGPGTDHEALGYVKEGAEFIISEESIGPGAKKWGQIELYRIAWIPLDYCERLT